LITVYLEYSGYDWSVLGQVGPKFIVFDQLTGSILPSYARSFRASEIAGWHAATAACFVVLLTLSRRTTFKQLLTAVIVVALLMGVGLLTGRRKVVMEFAVFLSTYFILWTIFEKSMGKLVIIALTTAACVGYLSLSVELSEGVRYGSKVSSDYSLYVQRTESAFRDAPSRFVGLGIAPVMWSYEGFGFLAPGWELGLRAHNISAGEGKGRRKVGWARSHWNWAYLVF